MGLLALPKLLTLDGIKKMILLHFCNMLWYKLLLSVCGYKKITIHQKKLFGKNVLYSIENSAMLPHGQTQYMHLL